MNKDFPKRLPEKLKAINQRHKRALRDRRPDLDAARIAAFESGEVDLPVSIVIAYAKVAGVPVENLMDDDRDLWLGHRVN